MKSKVAIVLAAVLLFLAPLVALADGISVWWMRGEAWHQSDESHNTAYLQGVLDGLAFSDRKVQGVEVSYDTSLEHLGRALDQFYSDYRNELIPVPFALKIISLELSGASEEAVKEELESSRAYFKRLLDD